MIVYRPYTFVTFIGYGTTDGFAWTHHDYYVVECPVLVPPYTYQ